MLDHFKTWRDSCVKLDSQEKALLAATNDVDYDQDGEENFRFRFILLVCLLPLLYSAIFVLVYD